MADKIKAVMRNGKKNHNTGSRFLFKKKMKKDIFVFLLQNFLDRLFVVAFWIFYFFLCFLRSFCDKDRSSVS